MSNTLETPKDVAAAPSDAEVTASGLASKILQVGEGDQRPGPRDTVEVHYSGWMINGKLFDSSVSRGETTSFPLNQVIPGWTEGLQLMKPGAKYKFYIPSELGYGERSPGGKIGPNEVLVFEVELLSVEG